MKVYWKRNGWGSKDEYKWTMVSKMPVQRSAGEKDLSVCLTHKGCISYLSTEYRINSACEFSLLWTFPLDFTKKKENEPLVHNLVSTAPIYLAQRLSKNGRFIYVLSKNN